MRISLFTLLLLSTATALLAADAGTKYLIEEIIRLARQRTVHFRFEQRAKTEGARIVGTGAAIYQAPSAVTQMTVDSPYGTIEAETLTDGNSLWRIMKSPMTKGRRVMHYNLASSDQAFGGLDPVMALGGIRTEQFLEMAPGKASIVSRGGESLIRLSIGDPANRSGPRMEFDLDRGDLFPRQMRIYAGGPEPVSSITIEEIHFGYPVKMNTFAYIEQPGDLVVSAGDARSSQGLKGKEAPPFSLPSLEGGTVDMTDLRGKHVLIDFWATWCPPCIEALPHVQELSTASDKLVVLTVSTDPAHVVRDFIKEGSYTFTTLIDADRSVSQSYMVRGIPTTFIVDPDGIVRQQLVGYHSYAQLRSALAKAGLPL